MYTCTNCGEEWETNYCPTCSNTIDHTTSVMEQNHHINKPTRLKSPISIGLKQEVYSQSAAKDSLREKIAAEKVNWRNKMFVGIFMAALGFIITIVSYMTAKSVAGGQFFVWYGIVIAGLIMVVRATIGFAKIRKIERGIG